MTSNLDKKIKRICVFCGANPGNDPAFAATAENFGRLLVSSNIELVYGGGNVGLMGVLADSVLQAGGKVTGIIPQRLVEKEVAHRSLSQLVVVGSMHERKLKMTERSDAFVALPGGFGTIEEIFEVVTWTQLGIHSKPCGFINVNGFYNALFTFIDKMIESAFIPEEHRRIIIKAQTPDEMIARLASWAPINIEKWLDRYQS